MTTERPLTVSESGFVLAGFGPIVVSTTCAGRIDPVVLERAWQRLVGDYPLLRCVIREDLVVELGEHVPSTTGADFAAEATTGLGGAVSRLTLHQTGDTAVVTLAVDHALSDARLVRTLVHTLFRHYTALLDGAPVPTRPRPAFEPTMEDELLSRYEPGLPAPQDAPVVLSGGTSSGFGVRSVVFGAEETAAIVAAAREHGITVNDLLCGAICCAIRERTSSVCTVALCIPVDLRPRLVPPLDPDAQLCAALPCVITVPVVGDPVEVGREVGARLRAAIHHAEPQRTSLAVRLAPGPPPPMTFMVSNVGVVENPVLPTGTRFVGSHFAATLHGPVPGMFVATVDGRLTLDVVHDRACQSDEEIGEVVGKVVSASFGRYGDRFHSRRIAAESLVY